MFRKMFTRKRKVIYSLIAATVLSSSAASAASYDYNTIYNTFGRGYTINYTYNSNYKYSYNYNNYNNNSNTQQDTTVYQYPNWTWSIVNTKPTTNTGNVVTLPKPSTPTTPTNPTPTTPTNPVPTTPTTPTKPAEPTNPVPTTPSVSGLSAIELEVVRLVNIERQKEGLQPLIASPELSNVARKKSEDMAKNNYFSHTSPTYGSPFEMMKQFGIKYNTAGENIAKGQLSAQSVVNAWMNSSGHRANIMNPSFNKIGVGHYQSGNGTNYWTQMFTN